MERHYYKRQYPRTLLADALALLMKDKNVSICGLSCAAGVHRGTIREALGAARSLSAAVRQKLFQSLLADERSAGELSALFAGDSVELLKIPAVICGLLAHHRASDEVDKIGRLCGYYGRQAIERDIRAMQLANQYPIAIRWCEHLINKAGEDGDLYARARGYLHSGRTKLASSTPGARDDFLAACKLAGEQEDGDDQWKLLAAASKCYRGWLSYEEGRHGQAIRECNNVMAGPLRKCTLTKSTGPRHVCTYFRSGGRGPQAVPLNYAGGNRPWPSIFSTSGGAATPGDGAIPTAREVIGLAVHIRAKALAEFAMYAYEFEEPIPRYHSRCYLDAGAALIESYTLSVDLGAADLAGHNLFWLARLLSHWQADSDPGGMRADYDLNNIYGALEKACLPVDKEFTSEVRGRWQDILPGSLSPCELLAKAAYEHFSHFQSSLLARAYYERAKGCCYACRGDARQAKWYFNKAIYGLTVEMPDARGLGPIYYESSRLCRTEGKTRESCEWAMAAAAVHPAGFILKNAEKCFGRLPARQAGKSGDQIRDRIVEFQQPFKDLECLSRRLWGDRAENILRSNMMEVMIRRT